MEKDPSTPRSRPYLIAEPLSTLLSPSAQPSSRCPRHGFARGHDRRPDRTWGHGSIISRRPVLPSGERERRNEHAAPDNQDATTNDHRQAASSFAYDKHVQSYAPRSLL